MKGKSDVFQLRWAEMPLSDEELEKIEFAHRIRPYLIFMENKDYYYGFPCTSKYYDNNNRYENGIARLNRLIDNRKSLALLGTVYKLPKKNLKQVASYVPLELENELIKKIQSNSKYCHYPEEVVEYFKGFDIEYNTMDMVTIRDSFFIILDKVDDLFLGIPVYKYPVNNTQKFEVDGIFYYADIGYHFYFDKSYIDGYSNMINKYKFYNNYNIVQDDTDYSLLCNLLPGMIIKVMFDSLEYKAIVFTNRDGELEVIFGEEGEMYSTFKYKRVPNDINCEYEIVGTLNDKRLDKLLFKYKDELKDGKVLLYRNNKNTNNC